MTTASQDGFSQTLSDSLPEHHSAETVKYAAMPFPGKMKPLYARVFAGLYEPQEPMLNVMAIAEAGRLFAAAHRLSVHPGVLWEMALLRLFFRHVSSVPQLASRSDQPRALMRAAVKKYALARQYSATPTGAYLMSLKVA